MLTINPTAAVMKPSPQSIDNMIDTLSNPRWAVFDAQPNGPIKFDCVNLGMPGTFVAHPDDPEPHGRQAWEDAIAGKYGTIGPYVAPPVTVEQKMQTQTAEAQDYFQGVMATSSPGPDRQMIMTEIQAAFTAQGYELSQIPTPWDRPVAPQDQAYFDKGAQAIQDTIDYLNSQPPPSKIRLPPFVKEK